MRLEKPLLTADDKCSLPQNTKQTSQECLSDKKITSAIKKEPTTDATSSLSPKKSKIMKKQTKFYATVADKASIKWFENFLKVEPKDSIFGGQSEAFKKALIFSAEKNFSKKDDGKLCKIFRRGQFIYYYTSYSDYHVQDALTGRKIGEAILENDWLQNISIDAAYRRQRIGTNLIRAIVKTIGKKFLIPAKGTPHVTSYFLSTEGAALITSCLHKRIIEDDQCLMDVPLTPSRSPAYSPGSY